MYYEQKETRLESYTCAFCNPVRGPMPQTPFGVSLQVLHVKSKHCSDHVCQVPSLTLLRVLLASEDNAQLVGSFFRFFSPFMFAISSRPARVTKSLCGRAVLS